MCGPQVGYSVVYEFLTVGVRMCVSEHMHALGYMRCFRDSECEAYSYNLCRLMTGRCDCILVSLALFIGAFSVIPPCEFSPCKSPTIGPL